MRSRNAARASGAATTSRRVLVIAGLVAVATISACAGSPAPPPVALPATAAAVTPPAASPPASSAPLPADLTGLAPADVVALFGQPDFRRSDPPAEIWQYRRADCILDIFLYADAGAYRVLYSETRQRRQTIATGGACAVAFVGRIPPGRL